MNDKEILLWIQDNLTQLWVNINGNTCMKFLDQGIEKQVIGTNIWDCVQLAVVVQKGLVDPVEKK